MNFRTLSPPLNKERPFDNDPFDRKYFAHKLNDILKNTNGITAFVHSPWGHGKSFFIRQWVQELKNTNNTQIAVFDAFSKDYSEDPFLLFMAEIDSLINSVINQDASEESDIKASKKLKSTLEAALKFGAKVAASTAKQTAKRYIGEVAENFENNWAECMTTESSDTALDLLENKFKKHINEIQDGDLTIEKFKLKLTESAEAFKDLNNGFPLTIIVDELDRCRPDYALSLLEKMKHLLNVDGVSFVIITDKFQLCDHIAHAYGIKSNDLGYISKFGDIFCDLPSTKFGSSCGHSGYRDLVSLWSNLIKPGSREDLFSDMIIEFASANNSSMRNVISMLKKGYLKMACSSRYTSNSLVVAMLSFMSVEHPEKIREAITCIDKQAEYELWIELLNVVEVEKNINTDESIHSYLNMIFADVPSQEDHDRLQRLNTIGDWFKSQKIFVIDTLIDFDSITKLEP